MVLDAAGEEGGTGTGWQLDDEQINNHPAYEQVMLDVNRCAGRLEHIKQIYFHRRHDDSPSESSVDESESESEEQCVNENSSEKGEIETTDRDGPDKLGLQQNLAKLIVRLLIDNPELHYYQGFHDVCLTYMTTLGPEKAYCKLRRLTKSHFGIFMKPTMEETKHFLDLLPTLVGLHSPKLQEFLLNSEIGTIFALSWVITWFSHVLPDEKDVEKIFEFLEKQDVYMIIYLCSEILLFKENEILELEPEMSTVHHFLCQLPRREKLPFDKLIRRATNLFANYPPEIVLEKHAQFMKSRGSLRSRTFLSTVTDLVAPVVTHVISSNPRTAIVVLILASAIILQFDRWVK